MKKIKSLCLVLSLLATTAAFAKKNKSFNVDLEVHIEGLDSIENVIASARTEATKKMGCSDFNLTPMPHRVYNERITKLNVEKLSEGKFKVTGNVEEKGYCKYTLADISFSFDTNTSEGKKVRRSYSYSAYTSEDSAILDITEEKKTYSFECEKSDNSLQSCMDERGHTSGGVIGLSFQREERRTDVKFGPISYKYQ